MTNNNSWMRVLPVLAIALVLGLGVVTADDLIVSLGSKIHGLASTVRKELANEAHPHDPAHAVRASWRAGSEQVATGSRRRHGAVVEGHRAASRTI